VGDTPLRTDRMDRMDRVAPIVRMDRMAPMVRTHRTDQVDRVLPPSRTGSLAHLCLSSATATLESDGHPIERTKRSPFDGRTSLGAAIQNMTDQARDLVCMGRLQSGDTGALSELYDRYSALMFAVAVRILRNDADAEDVLQEAWLQAWRRCGSFDAQRGAVASWLVTMARTRAIDRYRQRNVRDRVEAEVDADRPPEPERPDAVATSSRVKQELRQALGALDPKHRSVLEIAYFEGLSQTEIAERLNEPLGTVKYWTRQGLLQLRDLVPRESLS
jgi:RNA polymerase sigma-70 factor (ECF subfamily)